MSLRSRSAANARQARMSSSVNSGKSARICACVIPEARYSRTSVTVIRMPRMQGLPPRLPGEAVMRSVYFMMAKDYRGPAAKSNRELSTREHKSSSPTRYRRHWRRELSPSFSLCSLFCRRREPHPRRFPATHPGASQAAETSWRRPKNREHELFNQRARKFAFANVKGSLSGESPPALPGVVRRVGRAGRAELCGGVRPAVGSVFVRWERLSDSRRATWAWVAAPALW